MHSHKGAIIRKYVDRPALSGLPILGSDGTGCMYQLLLRPLLTATLRASALAVDVSSMEGDAGLSWGSRKADKDAAVEDDLALTPPP